MDWKILHRSSLSTNIQPAIRGRREYCITPGQKGNLWFLHHGKKSKIALLPFHAERKRWFYKLCGVADWLACCTEMMEKCPARHTVFLFLCQIAFWNYRGGVNTYICNNGLLPPIKKPEKVFWFLCCRTLKFRYKLVSLEIKNLALDSRGIFQV